MIWRRRRRGRDIIVYQLLLGNTPGLVLRMRNILGILTGIGWWKAHRPDVRSHQVKLPDMSDCLTRGMKVMLSACRGGETGGGQLISNPI